MARSVGPQWHALLLNSEHKHQRFLAQQNVGLDAHLPAHSSIHYFTLYSFSTFLWSLHLSIFSPIVDPVSLAIIRLIIQVIILELENGNKFARVRLFRR